MRVLSIQTYFSDAILEAQFHVIQCLKRILTLEGHFWNHGEPHCLNGRTIH